MCTIVGNKNGAGGRWRDNEVVKNERVYLLFMDALLIRLWLLRGVDGAAPISVPWRESFGPLQFFLYRLDHPFSQRLALYCCRRLGLAHNHKGYVSDVRDSYWFGFIARHERDVT